MKGRIKKYFSLLAAFVLTLNMIGSGGIISAQATPSASEKQFWDFEGYDVGYDLLANPVPGISEVDAKVGTTLKIKSDPLDPQNKAFEMYNVKGSGFTADLDFKVPDSDLTGTAVVVAFRFMRKAANAELKFFVKNGTSNTSLQRVYNGSTAGSGGTTINGAEFIAKKWYDMVYVFNTTAKTYDFYLDGVQLVTGTTYTTGSSVAIKGMRIYSYTLQSVGSLLYFDDVRIYSAKDTPLLRTTFPETDSTNVSAADSIVLQYNNSLSNLIPANVMSPANVIMTNNTTGLPVEYTGSIEGCNYKLKPTAPLDINTSYSISVMAGAQDMFNQNIPTGDVLTFTTRNQSLFITNRGFFSTEDPFDNITALTKNTTLYYRISVANVIADQWNSEVILAVYDDLGRLWKMKSVPISLSKAKQDIIINALLPASTVTGYKAKAFLWDGLGTIVPLQDPVVIPNPIP